MSAESTSFLTLIENSDLENIKKLVSTYPKSVHRHMAYDRPWGEELWLPLHHAVRLGKTDVVELLLELGSNVDGRTRFTEGPTKARATALHIAVSENKLEIARILLNHGADVRARKADFATPREMLEALIAAGHTEYQSFLDLITEFEQMQS